MFCPTCGHLKSYGYCAFCSRPKPNDVGTPMPPPVNICIKCGNEFRIDSKYKTCYECRLVKNPHAMVEKNIDEPYGD